MGLYSSKIKKKKTSMRGSCDRGEQVQQCLPCGGVRPGMGIEALWILLSPFSGRADDE